MDQEQRERNYVFISPYHRLIDFGRIRELWRYRDLIWLFTKRSFQLSYKQTILGPLWLFIRPLFSSVVLTVVFGMIAGINTDGVPHVLFYLVSTTVWGFFASTLTSNASTFLSYAGLFGKVYFPRLSIPVSNVLSDLIRLLINSLIIVAAMIYYVSVGAVKPHYGWMLLLPIVLIELGVMGMGCGIIISSLTTKYRDLSVLVGFGMGLWMYITPVVYPISQVTIPWLQTLLIYNPVTMPLEIFRYALFGFAYYNPISLMISIVFTLAVAFFGTILFHKVERNFMDTV